MERIIRELRLLEDKIKQRFKDSAWLFETIGNIKGYYGTGYCEKYGKRIMFVAERPSFKKNAQKDPPLLLFYQTL